MELRPASRYASSSTLGDGREGGPSATPPLIDVMGSGGGPGGKAPGEGGRGRIRSPRGSLAPKPIHRGVALCDEIVKVQRSAHSGPFPMSPAQWRSVLVRLHPRWEAGRPGPWMITFGTCLGHANDSQAGEVRVRVYLPRLAFSVSMPRGKLEEMLGGDEAGDVPRGYVEQLLFASPVEYEVIGA